MNHVDESTSHVGTPEGSGVEEGGATNYEYAPVVTFFAPGLGQFDLFEVGSEVKVLHKNLI